MKKYNTQFKYAACLWGAGTVTLIALMFFIFAINEAANEHAARMKSTPYNGTVVDGVTYDKKGRKQP